MTNFLLSSGLAFFPLVALSAQETDQAPLSHSADARAKEAAAQRAGDIGQRLDSVGEPDDVSAEMGFFEFLGAMIDDPDEGWIDPMILDETELAAATEVAEERPEEKSVTGATIQPVADDRAPQSNMEEVAP